MTPLVVVAGLQVGSFSLRFWSSTGEFYPAEPRRKLPNSVKKAAQRLAKEDGVSLNQWIAAAVAEKVGVMETAADFFKKRAGKAKGDGLMKFLRNAPRVAPEPEDQLR